MSTLLRWMLLSVFAAGGVGVAICLAVTSSPQAAKKTEVRVSTVEAKDTRVGSEPATVQPLPLAPSPPTPVVMLQPQYAQPHPLVAQDKSDMTSEEFLQQLQQKFERAIEAQAAAQQKPERASSSSPPEGSDELNEVLPSPAPGRSPSNNSRREGTTRVQGEGDDHLTIHIQDDDIRRVLEMISVQGGMNILPSPNVQGNVSASLIDVDIETAMAAILRSTGYAWRREGNFIYVGTAEDFKSQRQLADTIGTRIYRPHYVRAGELQALITPLLSEGIGAISVSGPAEVGIASDNAKAGGDNFAGGDALVVRDFEAVLSEIDQVVRQVDRKPLQVGIEAMILSVELDDENQFGVDFQFLRNNRHIRMASGTPLTDLGGMSFSDGGMKFGFLDSSLGAFLDALETVGDTSVIATPRLLCLNKHRAEILIGQQLGYISTTVTETSTAQSVEFLEVGTQLRLRPFISPDGMIRMEVHPELSTGSVELKGDFTLPEKEVTQVTTNIMVPDGCTMIIGGLMREDLDKRSSQLPHLGDIPGIGFLFRNRTETQRRSEILVLITPHIIVDAEACAEGERAACEFHRRHEVLADQMAPYARRHMARKFFRMAQEAWVCGDRDSAQKYIDLSINFDPINRAALELRSEICAGCGDSRAEGVVPVGTHPAENHVMPLMDEARSAQPNSKSAVMQASVPVQSAPNPTSRPR